MSSKEAKFVCENCVCSWKVENKYCCNFKGSKVLISGNRQCDEKDAYGNIYWGKKSANIKNVNKKE